MFEDFREKVRIYTSEKAELPSLPSEVVAKLKSEGLDPETVTLKQLFPEVLDEDGNDLSLMSAAETEIMMTYGRTRTYLLEKYPRSKEEGRLMDQPWNTEPIDSYDIDIVRAREDPQGRVFVKAMSQLKAIYDKVAVLQTQASDYEKYCLRLYWHLTYNWNRASDPKFFREVLLDGDIFELVQAYFKICRKYQVPTFEEPYYFLDAQRRHEIKLEGDMLKRTTSYCDFEIRVSILDGFE